MNGMFRKQFKARYALPVFLTVSTALSLQYRSWNPLLFSRYSLTFLLFFALLVAATAQAWRITLNERRWLTFSRRLTALPILHSVLLVACALFLLDLCSDLIEISIHAMQRNLLALGFPAVGILFLGLITLASFDSRGILTKVVLLLVSVCVSVGTFEALFRWFLLVPKVPQTERQFHELVASTWPDPIAPVKPSGTYRILGLADSFGQEGKHRNYHYILEDTLNASSRHCEVVNLSVAGYEPPDELELLRRFGPRFAPDLVLHSFFVGNDFWGPSKPLLQFRGISIRAATGFSSARPKNFALCEWLRRFFIFRRDRGKKKSERKAGATVGYFSREEFLRIERYRLRICHRGRPDESLLAITNVLDDIAEEILAMNADHVVVIHPDQYQVETYLFREICEQYGLNPEDYDLQKPQRVIAEYFDRKRIPYIDLLKAFRENGAGGGLYLLRHTHYNDYGNDLAASEIAKFLNQRFSSPEAAISQSHGINRVAQH